VFLSFATVFFETGDKQLARVKGVVGYQESDTSAFKPIFGRLDLPDDALRGLRKPTHRRVASEKTRRKSTSAKTTKVQVGAFNPPRPATSTRLR